jgi:hypothetical protein
MTDDSAVDHDYDEAERSYAEQVADALAGVQQSPVPGGVAIDIVTRQPMFVREKVADSLAEYYEDEGFDLLTYKMHPWLPGIGIDNAAYEAVYLDGNPQNAHKPGKTYDFPEARLMHFPVEMAWDAYDVGSL